MIPGCNVMLVGATGAGKTYSLRTLLKVEGIKHVGVIFTEPGMETVGDLGCEQGLHWHYIPPAQVDWGSMIDSAKKINALSFEQLTKLKDINKGAHGQFVEFLSTCQNFTCDRCGQSFGDVSTWGTDSVLAVDSLSGLNIMAMDLVVGSKPVKSMSDWGVAMDNLERLLQKLCTDTTCHFILTAHLERQVDEVNGGIQLMASTLGKKLGPRVPRFFSDVVLCQKKGTEFTWSTATLNVDLKARNLSLGDHLPPDFAPLLATWQGRGGKIGLQHDD